MSNQLKISTLRVTNFGGLKNLTQEFPPENLITIFGSNEAGKSTLAEAIMWLIAGPSASKSEIQRFGESGETLVAELEGLLEKSPLLLKAEFKILGQRVGARSPFDAQIGGAVPLSREAWIARLGSTSTESIRAVHRIDGADGHQVNHGEQVLEMASQGMFGGIDPRVVAARLVKEAKTLTTGTAGGSPSVANLRKEILAAKAALDEAGKNADDYSAAKNEQAETQANVTLATENKHHLSSELAALESARQACVISHRKTSLEGELASLEQVEPNWAAIANQIPDLLALQQFSRNQEPQFNEQIRRGEDAAQALGVSVEQLASLTLAHDDSVTLTNAVATLAQSQSTEREWLAEQSAAEVALPLAIQAQDQALAALGEQVTPATVLAANLGADSQGRILAAHAHIDQSAAALYAAQDESRTAIANVQVAQEAQQKALANWEQFGTGTPPQAWLSDGQLRLSTPVAASASSGLTRFIPALILGILSVAGFALGQPILGILAAVGLIVTLSLAIRGQASPTSSAENAQADLSSLQAAANAASAAALALNQQQTNLQSRQAAQALAEQDHTAAQGSLDSTLQNAGLPTVRNSSEVNSLLRKFQEARLAVDLATTAQDRLAKAQTRSAEAAVQVRSAERAISDQLASLRLPAPSPISAATDTFGRFRTAAEQAKSAVDATAKLSVHRQQVEALCKPVAQPGQVLDLAAVLAAAELAKDTLAQRGQLAGRIREQDRALQDQIGGSERIAVLLTQYATVDQFTAKQTAVESELAQVDSELTQQNTALGSINQRIEDLSKEGEIALLNEQLSALNEEQSESAVQGAVYAVAELLLSEQADLADLQNQPKLIERTSELARSVALTWSGVRVIRDSESTNNKAKLIIDLENGAIIPANQLSTGARAVLYLALRLAVAEDQSKRTGVWLPLICDDPLVHLDDKRAPQAMALLAKASQNRQVILLTCSKRSLDLAEQAGAQRVSLSD
jgi:uncharacterized protein YhaN